MLTSKTKFGFQSLFWLREAGDSPHFRAALQLSVDAFQLTRGEVPADQPVRATWRMGSEEPADIIHTTHVAPKLISARVRELLFDSGFEAWSTYDVELTGKNGESWPGYYGLVVHGRCGEIDEPRQTALSPP